jgi:hypothetical protein
MTLYLPTYEAEQEDEEFLDETDMISTEEAAELVRRISIDAGVEHVCAGCGCSQSNPCAGGCIWATETLCSRCV